MRNEEEESDTVIIGNNETLPLILEELPDNITDVYLAGLNTTADEQEELRRIAAGRNYELHYYTGNLHHEYVLLDLAQIAEHIVILSSHDRDPEEADMEVMFLLLNLRDLRKRYNLEFNITVEMHKEHNQKLVGRGDHTDFLVSSSMSSLILAQLAESPELISVFKEILSNEGNELYVKNAGRIHLTGEHTIRELRRICLQQRYILIGYLDADKNSWFNLPLDETVNLTEEDSLIVLGEN